MKRPHTAESKTHYKVQLTWPTKGVHCRVIFFALGVSIKRPQPKAKYVTTNNSGTYYDRAGESGKGAQS